jgi:sugar phosphate isomerase/epimerase
MKVGIELYTVKNVFRKNPVKTLKELRAADYKFIELFNHVEDEKHGLAGLTDTGMNTKGFKNLIDDLGIKVVGYQPVSTMVEDPAYWESDEVVQRLTDFCCEIGSFSVAACCEFWPSKDYVYKRAETFNRVGEICNNKGLKFVYHNHYNDFIEFDGESAFDILLGNTDPKNLGLEICVYWTLLGLVDPVKKIHEYGTRIDLIHEKDYPLECIHELSAWQYLDKTKPLDYKTFKSIVKPEHFIEIGEGIIKIQDVIDAGNDVGASYILVEQDFTKLDEYESMRLSMKNMKKMRGLEWD